MTKDSDQLAVARRAAPTLTTGPLDKRMRALHDVCGQIGEAIDALVPFPASLPFTTDARLSELTISLTAEQDCSITLRYRTADSLEEIAGMYSLAFTQAGVELEDPATPTATLAIVRGRRGASQFTAGNATCRVTIDDHGDATRTVRVTVEYHDFDPESLFDQFADWHHDAAPVEHAALAAFEIATLDNGPRNTFSTLYRSRYRLTDTDLEATRLLVEHRLTQAGWTWLEPLTNMLYLDGPFDAETHIGVDGTDVLVDFVGEFGPFVVTG